jgi:hypothetical protein
MIHSALHIQPMPREMSQMGRGHDVRNYSRNLKEVIGSVDFRHNCPASCVSISSLMLKNHGGSDDVDLSTSRRESLRKALFTPHMLKNLGGSDGVDLAEDGTHSLRECTGRRSTGSIQVGLLTIFWHLAHVPAQLPSKDVKKIRIIGSGPTRSQRSVRLLWFLLQYFFVLRGTRSAAAHQFYKITT